VHPTSKLSRPSGIQGLSTAIPTLKRWATFDHPSGMGTIAQRSKSSEGTLMVTNPEGYLIGAFPEGHLIGPVPEGIMILLVPEGLLKIAQGFNLG
jgi:hypothetical protein